MKSIRYKLVELFLIFIVLPLLFTFSFDIRIKIALGLIAFAYLIFVLIKVENVKLRMKSSINWFHFWKTTFVKLLVVIIVSILFVWFFHQELLFNVVIDSPSIWIKFLFIYTFISVFPQELAYRTFFFTRYRSLIDNERLFVFINAIIFALGHIFFKNPLVIVLTFVGGVIFALSFNKHKSTILVAIEHSIYGGWLFTVGLGNMLGFPV